jgi:hypothetical protein
MRLFKSTVGVASVFVLLVACASSRLRADAPVPIRVVDGQPTLYTTQVALGECVFRPEPDIRILPFAAIGTALLSSAVSEGVNRLGIALKEAAKEGRWEAKTFRNVEVRGAVSPAETHFDSDFGPCLQLVRGWFYVDTAHEEQKRQLAAQWFTDDFVQQDRFNILWNNRLWLAAPPDFLFEGEFDASENHQALTVAPHYVRLDEPIATRFFRPGKARHVAVFFVFHRPDEAADVENKPAVALPMGKLESRAARIYPGRLPLGATNRSPHESEWFTLRLTPQREPLTVTALVVETQEASEFLAFIAAVFAGAQAEITKQVQTAVIPAQAAAARESVRAEEERLATTYDQRFSAAMAKLRECASSSGNLATLAYQAHEAMRKLNQASRAWRKGDVFNESDHIVPIKLTGTKEEINRACQHALNALLRLS